MRLFLMPLVAVALCAGPLIAHIGGHDDFAAEFAKPIEKAHGIDNWKSKQAVRYDIKITFGGNVLFEGTTVFEIGAERVRMESNDGLTMVWDGKEAWYRFDEEPEKLVMPVRPRFHLRTWTYFLAVPFKLRDPGSALHELPAGTIGDAGTQYKRARLTFGENIGDAPDDWYIPYRNPKTDRLDALAYIVTYSKSQDEAEEKPSIVLYNGYKRIDGVALSTDWTFHYWSEDEGISAESKGHVKISNIKFITPKPGTFDKPEGAKRDPLPGK